MISLPTLDDRTYAEFLADARALIPSLTPDWTDHNPSDPGIMLVELFAWIAEVVLYRIDRVPERSYRTFLDLLRGPPGTGDRPAAPSLDAATGATGTDEPLDAAIRTVVADLRERHRAITPDDFQHVVLERWAKLDAARALGVQGVVRRALCVAQQSPVSLAARWKPGAQPAEGHVTVIVVGESLAAAQGGLPSFDPARRWALEFDGASAYVDCGADASLAVTGDLTLSAWIFPRNLAGGRQGIVSKGAAGEYEFVVETNGALTFTQTDGGQGGSSPADAVPAGRWSHVAAVRAASDASVTLFVNAQPVARIALGRAPTATANPLRIGRLASDAGGFFDGFMRDVAIWNRVRTASELGGDLRHVPLGADDIQGTTSPPVTPLACWRLDTLLPPGAPVPDCETLTATPAQQRHRDGTLHAGKFRDVVRPLDTAPALLAGLSALLDEWRLLTTRVDVVGYTPLRVTVSANLYLRADADVAAVRAAVPAALDRFLDPLTGWRGAGWPFGRAIYQSDVQSVLDEIPGVDFVTDVQIALADPAQIAAVTSGQRPPPPGEAGVAIGVALQPSELPRFDGATITLYQRAGIQWKAL